MGSAAIDLTDVGRAVQAFYEANPFPAFDLSKYRTPDDVRARASPYVLSALVRQLQWIWQLRWTGGYFLMVGRKREAP